MSNWIYIEYFKIFQIYEILRSRRTCSPLLLPEVGYIIQKTKSIPNIFGFASTL